MCVVYTTLASKVTTMCTALCCGVAVTVARNYVTSDVVVVVAVVVLQLHTIEASTLSNFDREND